MAGLTTKIRKAFGAFAPRELDRQLRAAGYNEVINRRNSSRLEGLSDSFDAIARATHRRQMTPEQFAKEYLARVALACRSEKVPRDLRDDIVRMTDLNLHERKRAGSRAPTIAVSHELTAEDRRYLRAVSEGDLDAAQCMVDAAAKRANVPIKTLKAYKLFRTLKTRPGEIFPLFIGKSTPTELGEWIPAEHIPTKGFAPRSGWHAGTLPTAPHLMRKDGTMPPDRMWAEIEVSADVDYQEQADASSTRDIRGSVPEGGFYRFKTNKMQGGAWIIGGAIKVKRLLSSREAEKITKAGRVSQPCRSKETAAVVYDDDGNVIPLSKRFPKR